MIGLQRLLKTCEQLKLKNEAVFVNQLKSDTLSNKKTLET